MIKPILTLHSEAVDVTAYDVRFPMLGPTGVQSYRYAFAYSSAMGRWVLSIYDALEDLIIAGAPVLLLVNLLAYAKPGKEPRGFLIAMWGSNADDAEEAGLKDLGSRIVLYYFERIEDLDDLPPVSYS
jgi:hypothetical protein